MYLKTHNHECGCNHKDHKIKVIVPTDPKQLRNKKFAPKNDNPFYGDAD